MEDLAPLRSGISAKYILNAAQKVAQGNYYIGCNENNAAGRSTPTINDNTRGRSKVAECSFIWITSLGSVSYGCVDETSKWRFCSLIKQRQTSVGTPALPSNIFFHYARTLQNRNSFPNNVMFNKVFWCVIINL